MITQEIILGNICKYPETPRTRRTRILNSLFRIIGNNTIDNSQLIASSAKSFPGTGEDEVRTVVYLARCIRNTRGSFFSTQVGRHQNIIPGQRRMDLNCLTCHFGPFGKGRSLCENAQVELKLREELGKLPEPVMFIIHPFHRPIIEQNYSLMQYQEWLRDTLAGHVQTGGSYVEVPFNTSRSELRGQSQNFFGEMRKLYPTQANRLLDVVNFTGVDWLDSPEGVPGNVFATGLNLAVTLFSAGITIPSDIVVTGRDACECLRTFSMAAAFVSPNNSCRVVQPAEMPMSPRYINGAAFSLVEELTTREGSNNYSIVYE